MKIDLSFETGVFSVPREITLRLPHRVPDAQQLPSPVYSIPISALSVEQLTALCNRFQRDLFEAAGYPVTCIHPEAMPGITEDYSKLPSMSDYTFAVTLSVWFEGIARYAHLDFTEQGDGRAHHFYASDSTSIAFWAFFAAVNSTLEVLKMSRAEFIDKLHGEVTPSDE